MSDRRFLDLYESRLSDSANVSEGYYNTNYQVSTDGEQVILRVPIEGCDVMDLRPLPEAEVLRLARSVGLRVPRVLCVSDAPRFQVHEYIPGERIDRIWPRKHRVPESVVLAVVDLMRRLGDQDSRLSDLQPIPWPPSGDTAGFFDVLLDFIRRRYEELSSEFGWLYSWLGVPDDPLEPVASLGVDLSPRPFRLVHADIHRKNCILHQQDVWFLDWELALVGDPAYDAAVHLHKMDYPPEQEDFFLTALAERVPEAQAANMERDVDAYRALEKLKSVLVDAVRYRKQCQGAGASLPLKEELVQKLVGKLGAASPLWEVTPPPRAVVVDALLGVAPSG